MGTLTQVKDDAAAFIIKLASINRGVFALLVAAGYTLALIALGKGFSFYVVGLGMIAGTLGLVALAVLPATAAALERLSKDKVRPRYRWRVLSREVVYTYRTDQEMVLVKRFRIRSLVDSLDKFEDRYNWSGGGITHLALKTPGLLRQLSLKETRIPGWDIYHVWFPRPLHKGEEADVEVELVCLDTARMAVPFLAATVEMPTDTLTLKVILFKPPTKARGTIWVAGTADEPLKVQEIPVDPDTKSVTWSPPDPQIGCRYLLTWEW